MAQDWFAQNAPAAKPAPAQTVFKTDTLELTAQPPAAPAAQDWFAANAPMPQGETTDDGRLVFKGESEPVGKGFGKEWWDLVDPRQLWEAVKNPHGAALGLISANPRFWEEAKAAAAQGDYKTALRKFMSYGTMGLGNVLDRQSELLEQGDYASAAGSMAGLATGMMAPPVVGATARSLRRGPLRNPNAAERAAVEFGKQEGVPIDAGTATGSPFVKRRQQVAGANMGGAPVAERVQTAQANALERAMQRLTGRAHITPVTAEGAGASVVGSLEGRIVQQSNRADDAYTRLRQYEANAQPTTVQQPVTGRVAGGGTVQMTQPQQVRLAVDLRPVRQGLQPIYDALKREKELVGTLQGGKARAFVALDTLLFGEKGMHGARGTLVDFAPLSVVDAALGDLKALARTNQLPGLRTQGQGVAAQAVKHLEAEVTKTATGAGPDVLAALKEGRSATITKHATAELLKKVTSGTGGEPVRVAGRLTADNDTTIALLRELHTVAPNELPKVGRAFLEGLLDTQTRGGIFGKAADGLWRSWHNLGDQTKAMLFREPGLVRDLDNFFLLAKRIGDNPNPSGSALSLKVGEMLATVPNYAMARLFYSPRAVKLMTEGLRIPAANRAGQAAWVAEFAKVAQEAGVTLSPAAAVADRDGAKKE